MAFQVGALVNIDEQSRPVQDPPPILRKETLPLLPDLPTGYELEALANRRKDESSARLLSRTATPSRAGTPAVHSSTTLDRYEDDDEDGHAHESSDDDDVDMERRGNSRAASPDYGRPIEALQTISKPPMNQYRVLTACLMNFRGGLNDSAPGALIPYLERQYGIGYAIVSLIFVSNAVGFIGAAPLTFTLQSRLGRARSYVLAEFITLLGYIILVCNPPFPAVVAAFFLLGLGMANNLAMNNVFCAGLANNTTILGLFHGSYGIGGTVGPLIATSLVTHGHRWSTFYSTSIGVTALALTCAATVFRQYPLDTPAPSAVQLQQQQQQPLRAESAPLRRQRSSRNVASPSHQRPSEPSQLHLLGQALHNRTTLLGAAFIFAYQGAEVSISGWIISFLLSYRLHQPSPSSSGNTTTTNTTATDPTGGVSSVSTFKVGYVTSGFWAGITLGRFILSHPAHKLGEKRATFALIVLAAGFQVLVWLLPDLIGDAVAVSLVGLVLGPIYPCATAVFTRLIPWRKATNINSTGGIPGRTAAGAASAADAALAPGGNKGGGVQTSSLAFISAMGSSGGALAPFFTGLLAQEMSRRGGGNGGKGGTGSSGRGDGGTWVLHPICIALFFSMVVCWACLPRLRRRRD